MLLSAGTVVTHHLSAFSLVLMMVATALALSIPGLARAIGWIHAVKTAWALTLSTALMATFWFFVVAPGTLSYLLPYVSQGFSELMQDARGSGAAKQLFTASLSPWWEQKSAYLVVFIVLGMAIVGLLFIRSSLRKGALRQGLRRALLLNFGVLGIAYFPSLLFIFSAAGSEGARRSWAFTWIELAIFLALPATWLIDLTNGRIDLWTRLSLRAAMIVALGISMIGGTASGLNASYRFPGPFLYGSDTRSITPELLSANMWFKTHFGTGNNIVTDRYTGTIFASYGLQNAAIAYPGFPIYDLYLAKSASAIPPSLVAALTGGHYDYLIVDRRMAYYVPEVGIYFVSGEPVMISSSGKPKFYGRLGKFDAIPWMTKVFQSDNYSIYRLNLPAMNIDYGRRPFAEGGRLVVTP